MKTVGECGEDDLIARLCRGLATSAELLVGPGDDCAVVNGGEVLTLLKTDAIVEGVHYLASEDPGRVGWKAVARVLSDFAAMGGEPRELLVTLALPAGTSLAWVENLYDGMSRCLALHGGVIAGGETTSLPDGAPVVISVAGRGMVRRDRLVTRSGGKVGDRVYVTGRLGGSSRGKHLDFSPRLEEAGWLVENFLPRAMMDLSDGLAKDLPRLARRSGCGFTLRRDSLPLNEGVTVEQALGDGEDYELLFTSGAGPEMREAWAIRFPGLELTEIGVLTAEPGEVLKGGWEHFRTF